MLPAAVPAPVALSSHGPAPADTLIPCPVPLPIASPAPCLIVPFHVCDCVSWPRSCAPAHVPPILAPLPR
eukprot:9018447-Alexandrium_andersonii.AAC.1